MELAAALAILAFVLVVLLVIVYFTCALLYLAVQQLEGLVVTPLGHLPTPRDDVLEVERFRWWQLRRRGSAPGRRRLPAAGNRGTSRRFSWCSLLRMWNDEDGNAYCREIP